MMMIWLWDIIAKTPWLSQWMESLPPERRDEFKTEALKKELKWVQSDTLVSKSDGMENIKPRKTYDRTVNINDKDDLKYLKRILWEEKINEIKSWKMTNRRWDHYSDIAKVNIVSEKALDTASKLKWKIKDVKLKSNVMYHGTSSDNAEKIIQWNFKMGSELWEDVFKWWWYGKMQNSISFAETPKDASRFSELSKWWKIIETTIDSNAKIVSIDWIEDAIDLEDFIPYLRKNKVDAVHIWWWEKEIVVINPKIIKTKSIYNKPSIWDKLDSLKANKELQPLYNEARKYKSADEFIENKADDYVKSTKEYKDWAKWSKNIVEAYHWTPYSFDKFEIGKKQAGAYDLDSISFATKKSNAEPFSRQYPDWYYKEKKIVDSKYDISDILEKQNVIDRNKWNRKLEAIAEEWKWYAEKLNKEWKNDWDWLYNNNYSKFKERNKFYFDEIEKLEKEYKRIEQTNIPEISKKEIDLLTKYNKEIEKLEMFKELTLNDNEIFEFEMEDFYNEIEKMTVIDTIKIVRAEKFDPWEYITKL